MHRIIRWMLLFAAVCAAMGGGFAAGVFFQKPALEVQATADMEEEDRMTTFRTERQQLRQMQISQLNEIIHGGSSDPEIVALAQRRLMELMDWTEQEATLEGVLALREYEDALVTVHSDSVNVMIRSESVTSHEAAVILELVSRETGISGGNIKIMPVN